MTPLSFGLPSINPVWPTYNPDAGDPRRGTFSTGATRDPRTSSLSVGVPVRQTSVKVQPLSFDKSVSRSSGGFSSAVPASFPGLSKSSKNDAIFGDLGNFLSTLSTGYSAGDTRATPGVYDDGILRQSRIPTPIAAQAPGTVAGGAFDIGRFKDIAKGITGLMGSSGDGDVVPVAYAPDTGSGVQPWMIAAGAVAIGAVVYFASK